MRRFFKTAAVLLAAVLMLSAFAGCGALSGLLDGIGGETIQPEDGYAEGRVGDTFKTAFFKYSVDSVAFPSEYEGYAPGEGKQLIDAVITIRNTFGSALPMYNADFQVQWHDLGNGDNDYNYGVLIDGSETVMPEEYELGRAEKVSYHLVYEVPAEAAAFSISFMEYFANDETGDTFFTYFEEK